jgi:octaprenyl-diphosphate synthase
MTTTPYQDVLAQARELVADGLETTDKMLLSIADNAPGELKARLNKIMERKGKRIRSTLLFLLAGTSIDIKDPKNSNRLAAAAASIELLHLASLLHDDVIDEQETRRGEPTAHEQWGNKMAVLVGDYALSKALTLVMPDDDRRVPTWVSESTAKLVSGEALEIDLASKIITLDQYIEVIDGKTAALVEAAGACSSIISGMSETDVDRCSSLGRDFGIAFQIVDDLLDYGIGAADLGKATFSDLSNGLMTVPLILFYENCSAEQKTEMESLRKDGANPETHKKIFSILDDADIFELSSELAKVHVKKAIATIMTLPENEFRTHLLGMCMAMANRNN